MGVQSPTRLSRLRDMAPTHFPNRKTFDLVSRVTGFQRAATPSLPPDISPGGLPESIEGKGPFPLMVARTPQLGRWLLHSLRRGACPHLAPENEQNSLVFRCGTHLCAGRAQRIAERP